MPNVLEAVTSCDRAAQRASRAADGPLSPVDKLLLKTHLMMCTGCVRFAKNLDFLRTASQRFPDSIDFDDE